FFTVAHRAHTALPDSKRTENIVRSAGAASTERHVVFVRSPLIGVTFDLHAAVRVCLQPISIAGQYFAGLRRNIVSVKPEVNVTELSAGCSKRNVTIIGADLLRTAGAARKRRKYERQNCKLQD